MTKKNEKKQISEETYTFERPGYKATIRRVVFETPPMEFDAAPSDIPGIDTFLNAMKPAIDSQLMAKTGQRSDMVEVRLATGNAEQVFMLTGEQFDAIEGAVRSMRQQDIVHEGYIQIPRRYGF